MNTKIIEELQKLPEMVMKKELEILEFQEGEQEFEKAMKDKELLCLIEITNAKGDDGKLKYSNETARNAELKRLLAIDPSYRNNETLIRDKRKIVAIKKIELNCLLNKQSNLRAIARMYEKE